MRARLLRLALLFFAALTIPLAQPPISARAGLVYYAEGDIKLDGRLLLQFIPMVRVAAGQRLSVEKGRVEVLLQPGNFLRLADHSQLEMISDALSNVEIKLHGVAILDLGAIGAKASVQAFCGNATAKVLRPGTYRFECDRDEVSDALIVEQGSVRVNAYGRQLEVTKNHLVLLTPGMKVTDLHGRQKDPFDTWNASRTARIDRNRGNEPILEDKNKGSPAGVVVLPDDGRGMSPN